MTTATQPRVGWKRKGTFISQLFCTRSSIIDFENEDLFLEAKKWNTNEARERGTPTQVSVLPDRDLLLGPRWNIDEKLWSLMFTRTTASATTTTSAATATTTTTSAATATTATTTSTTTRATNMTGVYHCSNLRLQKWKPTVSGLKINSGIVTNIEPNPGPGSFQVGRTERPLNENRPSWRSTKAIIPFTAQNAQNYSLVTPEELSGAPSSADGATCPGR